VFILFHSCDKGVEAKVGDFAVQIPPIVGCTLRAPVSSMTQWVEGPGLEPNSKKNAVLTGVMTNVRF